MEEEEGTALLPPTPPPLPQSSSLLSSRSRLSFFRRFLSFFSAFFSAFFRFFFSFFSFFVRFFSALEAFFDELRPEDKGLRPSAALSRRSFSRIACILTGLLRMRLRAACSRFIMSSNGSSWSRRNCSFALCWTMGAAGRLGSPTIAPAEPAPSAETRSRIALLSALSSTFFPRR